VQDGEVRGSSFCNRPVSLGLRSKVEVGFAFVGTVKADAAGCVRQVKLQNAKCKGQSGGAWKTGRVPRSARLALSEPRPRARFLDKLGMTGGARNDRWRGESNGPALSEPRSRARFLDKLGMTGGARNDRWRGESNGTRGAVPIFRLTVGTEHAERAGIRCRFSPARLLVWACWSGRVARVGRGRGLRRRP
jgi:hypothetical protein